MTFAQCSWINAPERWRLDGERLLVVTDKATLSGAKLITDLPAIAVISLTWVRGVEADGRNLAEISMIYEGQIRGVCLSRSGSRGRLFDGEDLLRY